MGCYGSCCFGCEPAVLKCFNWHVAVIFGVFGFGRDCCGCWFGGFRCFTVGLFWVTGVLFVAIWVVWVDRLVSCALSCL